MSRLNATHDPALRSWWASANRPDADFPIQNLPFAVFQASDQAPRCGVGIGDSLLDVSAVATLFHGAASEAAHACGDATLNRLMACSPDSLAALRQQLSALLAAGNVQHRQPLTQALVPLSSVRLLMPFRVSGYTDFFASVHHATNAGRLFRPDQPLLPNYKYVPVAYNGRANSVRVSGEPVTRPHGQLRPAGEGLAPVFSPSARLDHEVELGIVVGTASRHGAPIPVSAAWQHVFGVCLLNDWSARDVQAWEYQPLGPFLAKSFATSISPWVITAEALAPFRCPVAARDEGDPAPLAHLFDGEDQALGAMAVKIEARLSSRRMREDGLPDMRLSLSDSRTLYWTVGQMLAHHTSNGSALDTGDLIGTGTISGPGDGALGSLLEITRGGQYAFALPTGERRRFLEDGDEVTLRGYCERPGFVRIGLGECQAQILPAASAVTRPAP